MIIDQEILSKAAREYCRKNSVFEQGAFEAGARWAEDRMMRFVPWDFKMPKHLLNQPLLPDDLKKPT